MNPFRRILLATDLSQNCESAFCHALKMVVQSQGEFHLLHVDPEGQASFREFPQVRERLSQWGLLPEGAAREAVGELGIEIFKRLDQGDPLQGILEESEQFDAQLLVMPTHARQGWSRLLGQSVSHAAVRHSGLPGLLFPPHEEGFVDPDSGALKLERILVPVALSPDPRPAYRAALRILDTLKAPSGCITRVHVGPDPPRRICPPSTSFGLGVADPTALGPARTGPDAIRSGMATSTDRDDQPGAFILARPISGEQPGTVARTAEKPRAGRARAGLKTQEGAGRAAGPRRNLMREGRDCWPRSAQPPPQETPEAKRRLRR